MRRTEEGDVCIPVRHAHIEWKVFIRRYEKVLDGIEANTGLRLYYYISMVLRSAVPVKTPYA
jgi:hypothetical protein